VQNALLVACGVMFRLLRHILLLLVVFAIGSGTTPELARSAQYAGESGELIIAR
jgi:hypothetical protein